MPIIETTDLGHAYGDFVALHHVDLSLPDGSIGLVGANGAGKTTLIKVLLGILEPTAGTARVLGHDVQPDPIEVRSRIGYMPEAECLPAHQTAADFIGYAAELAGIPPKAARQRSSDVLTLVGLHEERFRYIREFSTGMRQRTKLAQAIVHHPDLVFLDEPTSGLDPEGREEMLNLIGRLYDFGINTLVSSHVLPDIERTCSYVVMLDGGKVVRAGPLEGFQQPGIIEIEVIGSAERFIAALTAAGLSVTNAAGKILVESAGADGAYDVIRNSLSVTSTPLRRLATKATTLEDVFLAKTTELAGGAS